mmetsp:Transcript_8535/g.21958  ORF Transcript_8535/g.21958 Transcript_8535/m.21958 type:complete len:202 (+) Transcript_8535:425-1030(+)
MTRSHYCKPTATISASPSIGSRSSRPSLAWSSATCSKWMTTSRRSNGVLRCSPSEPSPERSAPFSTRWHRVGPTPTPPGRQHQHRVPRPRCPRSFKRSSTSRAVAQTRQSLSTRRREVMAPRQHPPRPVSDSMSGPEEKPDRHGRLRHAISGWTPVKPHGVTLSWRRGGHIACRCATTVRADRECSCGRPSPAGAHTEPLW